MSKSNCVHSLPCIGNKSTNTQLYAFAFKPLHMFLNGYGPSGWGMPCVVWQLAAPIAALSEGEALRRGFGWDRGSVDE